jgi:hypothetical protein
MCKVSLNRSQLDGSDQVFPPQVGALPRTNLPRDRLPAAAHPVNDERPTPT